MGGKGRILFWAPFTAAEQTLQAQDPSPKTLTGQESLTRQDAESVQGPGLLWPEPPLQPFSPSFPRQEALILHVPFVLSSVAHTLGFSPSRSQQVGKGARIAQPWVPEQGAAGREWAELSNHCPLGRSLLSLVAGQSPLEC